MKNRRFSVIVIGILFLLSAFSCAYADDSETEFYLNPKFETNQDVSQAAADAVDTIVKKMNSEGVTGEYNRALWLHDWLIYHANYDYTYTYYSADGVLLYGTGVCQSYALAYQLLLDKVGIENQIISSYEMNHAWNLVKLNGNWCHVDCTWDDPDEGGNENWCYFGMNDEMMSRDHQWVCSDYPSCTSTANYYLIREGNAVTFSSVEQMAELLEAAAENQNTSFTLCYVGSDPDFNLQTEFEKVYYSINWKYGMREFKCSGNQYCMEYTITYTTPWDEPVTRPDEPAAAPSFTFNSPYGAYRLSDYSNNGLVLIFGRDRCSNTLNLISRLRNEVQKLNDAGVEILINLENVSDIEDVMAFEEEYPGFKFVYEQMDLLWEFLSAVNYSSNSVTFPCVFIINSSGEITYYSTGYITNMDGLVSEAFAVSTGQALPAPTAFDYRSLENGSGNVNDLSGDGIVSSIQDALKDGSNVICTVGYNVNSTYLSKWEDNYSLYHSLGLKLVASYYSISEEEEAAYPNVIFADFSDSDFWSLLWNAGFEEYSASYTCLYLYSSGGECISYTNGSCLSLNSCGILTTAHTDYEMKLPAALNEIGPEAFIGTPFGTVDLTGGALTVIREAAFSGCSNLRLIKIPDSVNNIADDAFSGCDDVVFICSGSSYACRYAVRNAIRYLSY